MRSLKTLHIIALGLLLIVAAFTFYRAFLYTPHSYNNAANSLLQMKQLHTELEKDILKIRNGMLKNYDSLVKDTKLLGQFYQEINLGNTENPDKQLVQLNEKYTSVYKQKMRLIEDFKRNYSIYRNSLIYFPTMVRELEGKLLEGRNDTSIKYRLEEFIGNVLLFSLHGDLKLKEEIRNSSIEIHKMLEGLSEINSTLSAKIAKHTDIITKQHEVTSKITNHIFDLNPEVILGDMSAYYANSKKSAERAIEIYRILFYSSIMLIIMHIFMMVSHSLRKSRDKAESANEIKSEFLASISHELRTPVNGIMGTTELLLSKDMPASQKNHLHNVFTSAENLLSLLNDVLDFSKIEMKQLELNNNNFNLKDAVTFVIDLLKSKADEKKLTINLSYDQSLPSFFSGDEARIRQALHNLTENAIKFTEQGSIDIEVKECESDNENHTVEISVTDSGIGLTDEQVSVIFDKFTQGDRGTTRKYGGVGLGLAICQELSQMMGGELTVESSPGNGSRFSFTVKLLEADQSAQESSGKAIDTSLSLKGKNILMAEDNRVNAAFAQELLSDIGCDVIIAKNGLEAVEIFSKNNNIDFVFMDIDMPEMDGYEATGKILEIEEYKKSKHVPIVALTANTMEGDREKCLDAGMDDYLSKPVKREYLANMIYKWAS